QTDFLAFHFAVIAGHETGSAQRATHLLVVADQCTAQTVANRAGLAAGATTSNGHVNIKPFHGLGDLQWLTDHHARRRATEIVVQRFLVYGDFALARLDEYTSRG